MAKPKRICSIPECGNPHFGKSFCQKHYQRLRFHGDPLYERPKHSPKQCSIEGCAHSVYGLGWCSMHYTRNYRHGDPEINTTSPGDCLTWLRSHVSHDREECLIWPYSVRDDGYGKLWIDGKLQTASRAMCEMVNGPAPSENLQAAHTCGNGHLACVHPKHLYWATPKQNASDKITHGTSNRGDRHGNAKLTRDAVTDIRSNTTDSKDQLAAKYGVTRATVNDVISGRRWKWLLEP